MWTWPVGNWESVFLWHNTSPARARTATRRHASSRERQGRCAFCHGQWLLPHASPCSIADLMTFFVSPAARGRESGATTTTRRR
jgi:hypothetical protein